jgi:hypothetical protein
MLRKERGLLDTLIARFTGVPHWHAGLARPPHEP